jgi:hypothetical protein
MAEIKTVPESSSVLDVADAKIVIPRAAKPIALIAVVVVAVVFVVTRGSNTAVVTPSAPPPVIATLNPHLPSAATAQDVFNGLGHAGLQVTAHTASAGAQDSPIVRKIFASYLGWPLDVTEYRSAALLAEAERWKSGAEPEYGDPPITIAGGNILIIWGPVAAGRAAAVPDDRQKQGLQQLVSALEVLLSPIRAKSSVPVVIQAVASAPPAAQPSAKPAKSAKLAKPTTAP